MFTDTKNNLLYLLADFKRQLINPQEFKLLGYEQRRKICDVLPIIERNLTSIEKQIKSL